MAVFIAINIIVAVVDWDSGGGKVGTKWDGAPHSSTVEQLTSLTRRALGENGEDPFKLIIIIN
jgi:hypothetical protein